MRRLTTHECVQWLQANHFAKEDAGHHFFPTDRIVYAIDFTQPTSSRGNAILAMNIGQTCHRVDETLLYIIEWGVWRTEESWPLFERAMLGYGDSRSLHDAPGFLYDANELNDLTALVRLALISGWSGAVLSRTSPIGFALTDDEWLGMFADSREMAQAWVGQEFFRNFDMRVLWEGSVE